MKASFLLISALLALGFSGAANAQSTQFILGIPSDNVRLSVVSFAPIPRLDRYDYPYQGFYHYYSLPGISGETNYNPFSYEIATTASEEIQFEFPESGNFIY